jgi:hypothetical protein
MQTVTIHTAKSTLSRLLARVEAGEEIVLARGKLRRRRKILCSFPMRNRSMLTASRGYGDPTPPAAFYE